MVDDVVRMVAVAVALPINAIVVPMAGIPVPAIGKMSSFRSSVVLVGAARPGDSVTLPVGGSGVVAPKGGCRPHMLWSGEGATDRPKPPD